MQTNAMGLGSLDLKGYEGVKRMNATNMAKPNKLQAWACKTWQHNLMLTCHLKEQ